MALAFRHPMPTKSAFDPSSATPAPVLREGGIEYGFIGKLQGLKYEYRPDIRDRAAREASFRHKFEVLNRVRLTDAEFARLLDEIITPDVFAASRILCGINSFNSGGGMKNGRIRSLTLP